MWGSRDDQVKFAFAAMRRDLKLQGRGCLHIEAVDTETGET